MRPSGLHHSEWVDIIYTQKYPSWIWCIKFLHSVFDSNDILWQCSLQLRQAIGKWKPASPEVRCSMTSQWLACEKKGVHRVIVTDNLIVAYSYHFLAKDFKIVTEVITSRCDPSFKGFTILTDLLSPSTVAPMLLLALVWLQECSRFVAYKTALVSEHCWEWWACVGRLSLLLIVPHGRAKLSSSEFSMFR